MKKWFIIPPGTRKSHFSPEVTEGFTFGFVQEEREKDYLIRCKYGQLYIPKSVVQPYTLMSFEKALIMLEEFQGHHCRRGEFQFNIKFYNWNVSPKIEGKFSDEVINDYYNDILENELRNLVDKKWCDGCLPDDFDWIENWWTDGRSGGWLVLEHRYSRNADDFNADWQAYKDQELEVLEYMEQQDCDPKQAEEDLNDAREGMREVEEAAIDLATDLALIEDIIEHQKNGLKDYLLTDEPWYSLIETLEAEEEMPDEIECPLCGNNMTYKRHDQKHTWNCVCGAKLTSFNPI